VGKTKPTLKKKKINKKEEEEKKKKKEGKGCRAQSKRGWAKRTVQKGN